MRTQMGVSEAMDSRVRRALLRIVASQVFFFAFRFVDLTLLLLNYSIFSLFLIVISIKFLTHLIKF